MTGSGRTAARRAPGEAAPDPVLVPLTSAKRPTWCGSPSGPRPTAGWREVRRRRRAGHRRRPGRRADEPRPDGVRPSPPALVADRHRALRPARPAALTAAADCPPTWTASCTCGWWPRGSIPDGVGHLPPSSCPECSARRDDNDHAPSRCTSTRPARDEPGRRPTVTGLANLRRLRDEWSTWPSRRRGGGVAAADPFTASRALVLDTVLRETLRWRTRPRRTGGAPVRDLLLVHVLQDASVVLAMDLMVTVATQLVPASTRGRSARTCTTSPTAAGSRSPQHVDGTIRIVVDGAIADTIQRLGLL